MSQLVNVEPLDGEASIDVERMQTNEAPRGHTASAVHLFHSIISFSYAVPCMFARTAGLPEIIADARPFSARVQINKDPLYSASSGSAL